MSVMNDEVTSVEFILAMNNVIIPDIWQSPSDSAKCQAHYSSLSLMNGDCINVTNLQPAGLLNISQLMFQVVLITTGQLSQQRN